MTLEEIAQYIQNVWQKPEKRYPILMGIAVSGLLTFGASWIIIAAAACIILSFPVFKFISNLSKSVLGIADNINKTTENANGVLEETKKTVRTARKETLPTVTNTVTNAVTNVVEDGRTSYYPMTVPGRAMKWVGNWFGGNSTTPATARNATDKKDEETKASSSSKEKSPKNAVVTEELKTKSVETKSFSSKPKAVTPVAKTTKSVEKAATKPVVNTTKPADKTKKPVETTGEVASAVETEAATKHDKSKTTQKRRNSARLSPKELNAAQSENHSKKNEQSSTRVNDSQTPTIAATTKRYRPSRLAKMAEISKNDDKINTANGTSVGKTPSVLTPSNPSQGVQTSNKASSSWWPSWLSWGGTTANVDPEPTPATPNMLPGYTLQQQRAAETEANADTTTQANATVEQPRKKRWEIMTII